MGAWDYGILDDDAAIDLKIAWDDYVVRGLASDPEFWTGERIAYFFEQYYFTSRLLTDRDVDVARLALAALYLERALEIPDTMRASLAVAAGRELAKERLDDWDSPGKRKKALQAFLLALGMEPADPPIEPDPLREEVEKWRVFAKQYPRWVEISQGPFGKPDEFFELAPKWFWKLQDFLGDGLRHKNQELTAEGMKYRLMHVAWWLGFLLRMPNDERVALIQLAETKGAQSFLIPRD